MNTQGADWADFIDLKVAQKSTPNMSVDVKVGAALVEITRSGATFKVFAFNLAQVNLAIGSNSSGSNRVDAVIMRIDVDTDPNALMNNIATIQVVPGTGTSALSDGAIQTAIGNDGFIRLANVTVANGATSIVTANISDTRARAATTDQVTYSPTIIRFQILASDPSLSQIQHGDMWYNSTAEKIKYYDGVSVITINSVVYTAGDGIDITSNIISVDIISLFTDRTIVASENLRWSNDAAKTTSAGSATKVKEILIGEDLDSVIVKFLLEEPSANLGSAKAQVYKNGSPLGAEQTTANPSTVLSSETFTGLVAGDLLQIYAWQTNATSSRVSNFRLYYNFGFATLAGKTLGAPFEFNDNSFLVSHTNQDP